MLLVKNGADAQRVFRLVFGAVRDLVVEGAETTRAISDGLFRLIGCYMAKNL